MKKLSDELYKFEHPDSIKETDPEIQKKEIIIGVFSTAKITEDGKNILSEYKEYSERDNNPILEGYSNDTIGIAIYSETDVNIFCKFDDGVCTLQLDEIHAKEVYKALNKNSCKSIGKSIKDLLKCETSKENNIDKGA